ncbi:hypothetical protein AYI69_g606 [Smittium culicis]|uniref:Reverse transcriptase zinc-binding domain-containing protein n=1 Tax=Smittium culicis TaxID=133412 RepID=A0A1R1YSM4_9FUNG|nr:hypothetical protein AYI69_g606 [Smittium culicis]
MAALSQRTYNWRKIRTWNKGIYSQSQECKSCKARKEITPHIYFGCKRVNDLWKKIYNFICLNSIDNGIASRFTTEVIFNFLQPMEKKFPKVDILYGLVIWNIYRARVETALSGIKIPGEGLFNRWKYELQQKITMDFKHTKKRESWIAIRTKWFSIEPGGKLVFSDS